MLAQVNCGDLTGVFASSNSWRKYYLISYRVNAILSLLDLKNVLTEGWLILKIFAGNLIHYVETESGHAI